MLKPNSDLTFTGYDVSDAGVTMTFTCADPGGGEPSTYCILLTDADLAGVTDATTFKALVRARLQRRYRATGIAAKLDALIGQKVTI